jgi:hypothetical protein
MKGKKPVREKHCLAVSARRGSGADVVGSHHRRSTASSVLTARRRAKVGAAHTWSRPEGFSRVTATLVRLHGRVGVLSRDKKITS